MVRYQNVLTAALPLSAQTYQAANPRSYFAKQFSKEFNDGFSVLKHYGGNGPWSEGVSYGIDRDPPACCTVDQVIMIHRHGERYPDIGPRADMLTSLEKVYDSNITEFKGGLAFLNTWTSFLSDYCLSGQESFSGPYAGLLSNRRQGAEYRERYGHLWDGKSIVPIFTSDYERVIESARSFGEGFFAYNYSANDAINIISESESQGVNSLTPLCYTDDDTETCDNLTNLLPQFYGAAARLTSQNPGLDLNATDTYNLMQMAAFELNVRPYSEWIGAFTLDEWVSYGYSQDLQYYYCAGPGDKNMNAVGAVFVNASLSLLNEGPSSGTIFFNFALDTNITPIIGLLGLFKPAEDLPVDSIPFPNTWSTGNIVPQSAHFTIERLTCSASPVAPAGVYVRLVVNEAVIPFKASQAGPGYSCPLDVFTNTLRDEMPSYIESCGVPETYPQYLDFWWSYNTTTTLNYQDGPISCAQGTTTP